MYTKEEAAVRRRAAAKIRYIKNSKDPEFLEHRRKMARNYLANNPDKAKRWKKNRKKVIESDPNYKKRDPSQNLTADMSAYQKEYYNKRKMDPVRQQKYLDDRKKYYQDYYGKNPEKYNNKDYEPRSSKDNLTGAQRAANKKKAQQKSYWKDRPEGALEKHINRHQLSLFKVCNICKEIKAPDQFRTIKRIAKSGGFKKTNTCILCINERSRIYNKKHKAKVNKRNKAYSVDLSDGYVKGALFGYPSRTIIVPKRLIEAHRSLIMVRREIRSQSIPS